MEKKKKDNIKRLINNINKKLILAEILLPNGFFGTSDSTIITAKRLVMLSINFLEETGNLFFHNLEFFDSHESNISRLNFLGRIKKQHLKSPLFRNKTD